MDILSIHLNRSNVKKKRYTRSTILPLRTVGGLFVGRPLLMDSNDQHRQKNKKKERKKEGSPSLLQTLLLLSRLIWFLYTLATSGDHDCPCEWPGTNGGIGKRSQREQTLIDRVDGRTDDQASYVFA